MGIDDRNDGLLDLEAGNEPCSGGTTDCVTLFGGDFDRITLVGLIFETAFGLRRELLRTIDGELGIAGLSFDVLLRLLRSPQGRLRMTDLAAQTGLSPSGLTRAIDRLVEAKFLERTSCASDRRGAFAALTEFGRTRTEEALAMHRHDVDEILNGVFDDADEHALVQLLRRLRDRVQPDATLITEEELPVSGVVG